MTALNTHVSNIVLTALIIRFSDIETMHATLVFFLLTLFYDFIYACVILALTLKVIEEAEEVEEDDVMML